MQDLAIHLNLEKIKQLSLPSNFAYGEAIFKRGAVEFIHTGPFDAEAWVGGLDGAVRDGAGSRRRTRLYVTPQGLSWHCAGNPKNHDIFCKHCVALALSLISH